MDTTHASSSALQLFSLPSFNQQPVSPVSSAQQDLSHFVPAPTLMEVEPITTKTWTTQSIEPQEEVSRSFSSISLILSADWCRTHPSRVLQCTTGGIFKISNIGKEAFTLTFPFALEDENKLKEWVAEILAHSKTIPEHLENLINYDSTKLALWTCFADFFGFTSHFEKLKMVANVILDQSEGLEPVEVVLFSYITERLRDPDLLGKLFIRYAAQCQDSPSTEALSSLRDALDIMQEIRLKITNSPHFTFPLWAKDILNNEKLFFALETTESHLLLESRLNELPSFKSYKLSGKGAADHTILQEHLFFLHSAPHLQELTLNHITLENDDLLLQIQPESLKKLTHIDFGDSNTSVEFLNQIIKAASNLKSVVIWRLINSFDLVDGLFKKDNYIENLELGDSFVDVRVVDLIFKTCLKLKHFRLKVGEWINPGEIAELKIKQFPSLESLELIDTKISVNDLQAIFKAFPNLTCLRFSGAYLPKEPHPKITHIGFSEVDYPFLSIEAFENNIGCFPNLQTLDFSAGRRLNQATLTLHPYDHSPDEPMITLLTDDLNCPLALQLKVSEFKSCLKSLSVSPNNLAAIIDGDLMKLAFWLTLIGKAKIKLNWLERTSPDWKAIISPIVHEILDREAIDIEQIILICQIIMGEDKLNLFGKLLSKCCEIIPGDELPERLALAFKIMRDSRYIDHIEIKNQIPLWLKQLFDFDQIFLPESKLSLTIHDKAILFDDRKFPNNWVPRVKSLVTSYKDFSKEDLLEFIKKFAHLEELDLSGCQNLDHIAYLRNVTFVQRLNFSNSNISYYGLTTLLRFGERLKSLQFDNCPRITSGNRKEVNDELGKKARSR